MSGPPARIPVSEVAAYAALHQYSLFKAQHLLKFIDAMDRAYIAYIQKLRDEEDGKRSKEAPKKKPSGPARR